MVEVAARMILTDSPKPRFSGVPMAVCLGVISLSVHNGEPVSLSASVLAFHDNARRLMNCRKGDAVCVSGELMANTYEGAVRLQVKASTLIAASNHVEGADADIPEGIEDMPLMID